MEKLPLRLDLLKQRFISSLLLCAFAIIFAHSVIPHHHHDEAVTAQHNTFQDDDHDDLDHHFLGQAFSFFQHDQGGIIIYEAASSSCECSKIKIVKDAFLLAQHVVRLLYEPPLRHSANYSFSFTSSSYTFTNPFRGPPVLVG